MLNALTALRAAGVPGFRSTFRATPACSQPPDCYCVYLYTRTPAWFADDKPRATRVKAFLHLISRNDPEAAQAAIEAAMTAEGFTFIRQTEGYDDDALLYGVHSEWEGMRYEV